MRHIQELYDITPENKRSQCVEWLLSLRTTAPQHKKIMADARMWQCLFEEIQKEKSLHTLEDYLEPLLAWNAEKTMAYFVQLADREMRTAGNRKAYYFVLHRLMAIRSIDGGKTQIVRLLDRWAEQYPRRSAMQDEMQRLRRETML